MESVGERMNGGYVGLVALLVSVAVLAWLYVHTYMSPTPQQVVTPRGAIETTTTATEIETAHQNLKTAEAMQQKMNQQNQEINKALGE